MHSIIKCRSWCLSHNCLLAHYLKFAFMKYVLSCVMNVALCLRDHGHDPLFVNFPDFFVIAIYKIQFHELLLFLKLMNAIVSTTDSSWQ